MNVNLGLPARCHSVKQAYRMTGKSFFQFPERPCLCLTQRRNTYRFGDLRMSQTAYLVWIGLQYALLFQSTANRQTATNSFYQGFPSHLRQHLRITQPESRSGTCQL